MLIYYENESPSPPPPPPQPTIKYIQLQVIHLSSYIAIYDGIFIFHITFGTCLYYTFIIEMVFLFIDKKV